MKKVLEDNVVLQLEDVSKAFSLQNEKTSFYALSNISFSLKRGEILGVIGRNGAGKSTLLKILGDILPPTSGNIWYTGSMVSILDIGSGFHPDLTGYDNIFLNASILGMTRAEIKQRVDLIIEFSGIGHFIHQPIKTYSNGMYLRLAFSIAIHLNPQILLLDEVVAVGDNEFKDKCNTKLHELADKGLTIILVTHNMAQVLEFCTRCLWLEDGKMKLDGKAIDVVEKYIGGFSPNKEMLDDFDMPSLHKEIATNVNDFAWLQSITITSGATDRPWPLYTGDPIHIKFICKKNIPEGALELALYLTNLDGLRIFLDSFALRPEYKFDVINDMGNYEISCTIPSFLLTRGVYHLSIVVARSFELLAHFENVVSFKVLPSTSETGTDGNFNRMNTIIAPRLLWQIKKEK